MKKNIFILAAFILILWSCSDNCTAPGEHHEYSDRIEFFAYQWDSTTNKYTQIVGDTFSRSFKFIYKRVVFKEHLKDQDRIFLAGLRENGDTMSKEYIFIYSNDERHYYDAPFHFDIGQDSCYRFGGYYIKDGKLTYLTGKKVYIVK